jgi:hypothetical protein
MTVKIAVIPWEAHAGQFGVMVEREAKSEAYFVGCRDDAEKEAKNRCNNETATASDRTTMGSQK